MFHSLREGEGTYLSSCSHLIPGNVPFHLFSIVNPQKTTRELLFRGKKPFPCGVRTHHTTHLDGDAGGKSDVCRRTILRVEPGLRSAAGDSLLLLMLLLLLHLFKSGKVTAPPALTHSNFPPSGATARRDRAAPHRDSYRVDPGLSDGGSCLQHNSVHYWSFFLFWGGGGSWRQEMREWAAGCVAGCVQRPGGGAAPVL